MYTSLPCWKVIKTKFHLTGCHNEKISNFKLKIHFLQDLLWNKCNSVEFLKWQMFCTALCLLPVTECVYEQYFLHLWVQLWLWRRAGEGWIWWPHINKEEHCVQMQNKRTLLKIRQWFESRGFKMFKMYPCKRKQINKQKWENISSWNTNSFRLKPVFWNNIFVM